VKLLKVWNVKYKIGFVLVAFGTMLIAVDTQGSNGKYEKKFHQLKKSYQHCTKQHTIDGKKCASKALPGEDEFNDCMIKVNMKFDLCTDHKKLLKLTDDKSIKKLIIKHEKTLDKCITKGNKCAKKCAKIKKEEKSKKCTIKCLKANSKCQSKENNKYFPQIIKYLNKQ